MKIDIKKYKGLEKKGLLVSEKHEVDDLVVWNYTKKAEKDLIPEVKLAKGLITDLNGNIVSMSFSDSFVKLPTSESFKVFNKLDGTLGVLYWMKGEPYLATPESFISDQAMMGSVILRRYDWSKINKKYTYLFEIIYPENKKVIDYGGAKAIILLAVIDNKTGRDLNLEKNHADFPYLKEVPIRDKNIKDLQSENIVNQRGYVLLFKDGKRLSIEFKDYLKLKSKLKIGH